ncbi:hypothetical protein ES703_123525 [subsurface metagenome]
MGKCVFDLKEDCKIINETGGVNKGLAKFCEICPIRVKSIDPRYIQID